SKRMSIVTVTSKVMTPGRASVSFLVNIIAAIMLTVKRKSRMLLAMAHPRAEPDATAATMAVAAFLDDCRSANTRAAYQADLAQLAAWCREGGTVDLLSIDS